MDTELCSLGYSIPLKQVSSHIMETIRRELYVKPIENPNFDFGENKEFTKIIS